MSPDCVQLQPLNQDVFYNCQQHILCITYARTNNLFERINYPQMISVKIGKAIERFGSFIHNTFILICSSIKNIKKPLRNKNEIIQLYCYYK